MATESIHKKLGRLIMLAGLLSILGNPGLPAYSYAQPFVGEVMCGGWNYCPTGWAECNGQLLPISENETLFILIGSTYGGDGETTFALPNLASRTMVHQGNDPTQGNTRVIGEIGGSESVSLSTNQIPSHNHLVVAQGTTGDSASPTNRIPAGVIDADARYSPTSDGSTLAPSAVQNAGGSQPHNNLQPYLAVKCCISLFGIFPPQN